MPLELQIIRASEFIRLAPNGAFDLSASKAALAELAGACHKRGIDRALLDIRGFEPGPRPLYTLADLSTLVNTFSEIGFTGQHRLALLYRTDPHRRARLFASLSAARGWTVQAFDDFEEALLWLSAGANITSAPAAADVPVRRVVSRPRAPHRTRNPKSS